MGAVLSALHGLRCGGDSDFVRGIQIAQLALKHRMNKNQKQRIIAFVGSPIKTAEKQLVTLGKQLKKNNVALDLISFGEVDHNAQRLKLLNEAVDSNGTSCLLECRAEAGQVLSEVVLRSPLLRDPETGAGPRSMGVGEGSTSVGAMNDFGVDPNTDPELYMALQLSLQEEQNRTARLQEQAAPSAAEEARGTEPTATNGSGADASGVPTVAQIEMMEDIDDELRQALLLSLQDYSGQPASQEAEMSEAAPAEQRGEQAETPVEAPKEEKREQPGDSELAQVLGSLPGVDVSDPRLQEVLREAASSPDEEAKETEKNNEGS